MELVETLMNNALALSITLTPLITMLVQAIKKTSIPNNYLPHVSVGIGVAAGLIVGWYLKQDLFLYGLAGLTAGFSASGLYDTVKAPQYEPKEK